MPSRHDARSNWFGVSWKGGGREGGREGRKEVGKGGRKEREGGRPYFHLWILEQTLITK